MFGLMKTSTHKAYVAQVEADIYWIGQERDDVVKALSAQVVLAENAAKALKLEAIALRNEVAVLTGRLVSEAHERREPAP